MFVYPSTRCIAMALMAGAMAAIAYLFFVAHLTFAFGFVALIFSVAAYRYDTKHRNSHRRYRIRRERRHALKL